MKTFPLHLQLSQVSYYCLTLCDFWWVLQWKIHYFKWQNYIKFYHFVSLVKASFPPISQLLSSVWSQYVAHSWSTVVLTSVMSHKCLMFSCLSDSGSSSAPCVSLLSPPAGLMVRPSVSLLPPSSEQLSGGSATLACLLTGYSPQGAVVSWEVDGAGVTEGVLTSSEEEKSGRYSSSSTLSLSQERWMEGELYSCKVLHHDHSQTQSLHRSQCQS